MGILDRVLGHRAENKQPDARPEVAEVTSENCPHTALVTHWENPADMGKADLATYRCEACDQVFGYDEARQYLEQPPAVLASTPEAPLPYDDGSGST
jgi:hypothetical protein